MRLLIIGRDPNLFNPASEAFLRVKEYADLFEEYHIISAGSEESRPTAYGNFYLWPTLSLPLFFSWLDAIRLGKKIARKHRIQLIDAQDAGEAGVVAFLLSKITGVPFRVQVHTDIFSPFYRHVSWKERLRWLLAKFLIPRASCIRVVSERIKNSLSQAKPFLRSRLSLGQVTVLPIFTDVKKFLEAKKDQAVEKRFRDFDFKMIAVGRFVDKEKNFSMLIELMANFVKISPMALLVLVGDGPDRKNYEERIKSRGLENNVILEEWRGDLPSFYKSFDLYLLSSNYEGWGRTVIEAMASGLPIVMTDVGLAKEVVTDGKNGVIVPVQDKERFLGAVEDLYKNPDKRDRLIRAGIQTIQTIQPTTKSEYLALYKDNLAKCGF